MSSVKTELTAKDVEKSLKDKNEMRSKRQGVVRTCITKLRSMLEEDEATSLIKVEDKMKKLLLLKRSFSEAHDSLVELMDVNELDTTDIMDKCADLDEEVKVVYTEAKNWISAIRARFASDASVTLPYPRADVVDPLDVTVVENPAGASLVESTFARSNAVLQDRLRDKDAEIDDLRDKLDQLSQIVSRNASAEDHVRSLESSIDQMRQDHQDTVRKFTDKVDRLEADISVKDRHLQESRRLTFNPGAASSPRSSYDTFAASKSMLAREDLSAISYLVAESNAQAFKGLLDQSNSQYQKFYSTMNIPQVEIKLFTGDLTSYFAFTNRFDELIGKTDASDSIKLSTFLQYCSDDIREELDCCNHKSASEGYVLARKMLRDAYGDPFLISQAWVDKLMNFSRVKTPAEIVRYSAVLRSASVTLSSLGYLSEIECTKSMRAIIEKTPMHVQNKWRAAHREAREAGNKATLEKMIRIIDNAAKEMSDPIYGQDSLARLNNEDDVKPKRQSVGAKKKPVSAVHVAEETVADKKSSTVPPKESCVICGDAQRIPHLTSRCFVYRDMSGEEKLDFAIKHNLCFLCLNTGHRVSDCPSPSYWKCRMPDCALRHHFTLHRGLLAKSSKGRREEKVVMLVDEEMEKGEIEPYDDVCNTEVECVYRLSDRLHGHYLLPILPVTILGPGGFVPTHVLFDTGSCVSLLAKNVCEKLALRPVGVTDIKLKGMFAAKQFKAKVVDLSLKGKGACLQQEMANVVILDSLSFGPKHVQAMREVGQYPHMASLELSPYHHDRIEMLIGQDNAFLFEPLCRISGRHKYSPYAVKTRLGWTVHGNVGKKLEFYEASDEISRVECLNCPQIEDTLKSMWELDKVPDIEPVSPINRQILKVWDEKICMRDGHWELPIPFVKEPPDLPDNYQQAKKNLEHLGRRLNRNDDLKRQYVQSMVKNFTSGYAEIAPAIPDRSYEWYNTHLPVIAENRPGKCRIVKNASLPFHKTSLNDSVHQGPNLTANIVDINIRFRVYRVAMTGDVKEMYNQVRVPEYQRDSLRFLWWKDDIPGGEIVKYRMVTHMFGGRWSGAASMKALSHTADAFGHEYDATVVDTLKKDFYVDDWLKSVLDTQIGLALLMNLRRLLRKAGFELVKFGSNCPEILKALPAADVAKVYESIDVDTMDDVVDKTLGSLWRPKEDVFGYKTSFKAKPCTRRGMLSIYSTIYDPMGFAGPVVFRAKLLVQAVCQAGLEWDQEVTGEIGASWREWLDELEELMEYKIPRWLGVTLQPDHEYQIHTFVDASESGYGANSYLCILDMAGSVVRASLVMSKAKVNPVKQVTIPRLELCAAVLGTKTEKVVRRNLDFPIKDSIFWSDSQIVLFYIKQQSRQFRTFVANRVAVIQESTEVDQWRFVPGDLNIADLTSRGCSVKELMNREGWLRGPEFLYTRETWPEQPSKFTPDSEIEQKKQDVEVKSGESVKIDDVVHVRELLARFSQWPRLIKSVCYLQRLVKYLKDGKINKDVVTRVEFDDAIRLVVGWIQKLYFDEERVQSANFQKLSPVFRDGVYRVGGRLTFTSLGFEERHPMILPRCQVTEMYIRHVHVLRAHAGVDGTFYETRKAFWIMGGRSTIRVVIRRCADCHKFRGKPSDQFMSPLPPFRVQEGNIPFETVGIDLFGPIMVRVGRSDCKRWCCMITCAASRASHIEVVPDISTSAFIDALNRFMARRGRPKKIISDNGTNFVGAARELNEMVEKWNSQKIKEYLRGEKVDWQFNTPAASHHGGFWEIQNKSARDLMMRLVKCQTLSEFALLTVVCKIESIMNSRPLTKLSEDPENALPLTPNHLLHVYQCQGVSGNFSEADALRRKWKQVEHLSDEFWRTWTQSYLKNLQVRQKWNEKKDNIKVDEIVLEMKPNQYRMQWPLARVVEVFPGKDGLVRSVKIRTAEGTYERPITKIVRLELDQ